MPTILRSGPYRFFFYAGDRNEPPQTAKFWLEPVRFQVARGFSRGEILQIQRLVEENNELLLRGWNDYFGT